ncbi:TolB family protein [Paenibacillus sp. YIM B09110]|uniref:TolB family protein n=1 Tax=Paenibacillus sp. YIM B09110 TaxID=3126102 RepID=UPI00301D8B03
MRISLVIVFLLLLLIGCDNNRNNDAKMTETPTERPVAAEGNRYAEDSSAPPLTQLEQDLITDDLNALTVNVIKQNDGIKYVLNEENAFVAQTIISNDNEMPVIHIVQRLSSDSEWTRYQLDLLAVYPEEGRYSLIPFADIQLKDGYSVSSTSRIHGFLDPARLILIQPSVGEAIGSIRYDVVSLDLKTLTLTTVAENVPNGIEEDHLGKSWLNAVDGKLYLNVFGDGRLWIIDVRTGESKLSDNLLPNPFPFFMLTPSPSGDRIWYEAYREQGEGLVYHLYNEEGELIKRFSNGYEGYDRYSAFQWSADSRLAVYEYTRDQSSDNVLGGEENYIIAPQGVQLLDRSGSIVWETSTATNDKTSHVEWRGWLSGDSGILQRYELEFSDEGSVIPVKQRSTYEWIDVTSGKAIRLTEALRLEDLEQPELVTDASEGLLFVDRSKSRYFLMSGTDQEYYKILSTPEDKELIWSRYHDEDRTARITRYRPETKESVSTALDEAASGEIVMIGDHMLFAEGDLHYHFIQK